MAFCACGALCPRQLSYVRSLHIAFYADGNATNGTHPYQIRSSATIVASSWRPHFFDRALSLSGTRGGNYSSSILHLCSLLTASCSWFFLWWSTYGIINVVSIIIF